VIVKVDIEGVWADQAHQLDPHQWVSVVLVNQPTSLLMSEFCGVCQVKDVYTLLAHKVEDAPLDEFLLVPCAL
jgi:hypothetical protein